METIGTTKLAKLKNSLRLYRKRLSKLYVRELKQTMKKRGQAYFNYDMVVFRDTRDKLLQKIGEEVERKSWD